MKMERAEVERIVGRYFNRKLDELEGNADGKA